MNRARRFFRRGVHRFLCGREMVWGFCLRDGLVRTCLCGWRDDGKAWPPIAPARAQADPRPARTVQAPAEFTPYDLSPDGDEFFL